MNEIQLFENQEVRRHFNTQQEIWFFSIVDIVSVLTGSHLPKRYWSDLKRKLISEGSQLYEKIVQLKFKAADGKSYATDCMSTQDLLRLVQSIPSPKAEPFKVWLAKVGYERIQELNDPAQSLDRARENWQRLGRSEKWIQPRMTGQETRNKLTDYWRETGVTAPDEFALLTDIIHQEWTGLSVKGHKALKDLKTQNLRDHMSEGELLFTALAELATRQIADRTLAQGLKENAVASKRGGAVAKVARVELEAQTGQSVVTGQNFLPPAPSSKRLKK
jgi:DNA-damage-inducible protein D